MHKPDPIKVFNLIKLQIFLSHFQFFFQSFFGIFSVPNKIHTNHSYFTSAEQD